MCRQNVRSLPVAAEPRRWRCLAAIAFALLILHGLSLSSIQAAPATQIQWLGSYDITNLDPTKAANDFHALLSDMRVKFKFGRTNTVPLSQPPTTFFNLKVLNPAQNNFFDYAPADNNFPVAPGDSMRFTYLALAPPGFLPPLPATLNAGGTFLTNTTNGVTTNLRTRMAQVGVVVNRFGNLVRVTLDNQDNTALVLTNLQVWGDSTLDFNDPNFDPNTGNSTLEYSASTLSLNTTFDVPQFSVNDPFAPIIFEAEVAESGTPDVQSFEMIAFQDAVPEPASVILWLGLTACGLWVACRRSAA